MSTSPGFLDVKMRSELVEQPRRVVGALGGPVSLTCRLRVDPSLVEEAEVYWTKDGRGTLKERTSLGKYSAHLPQEYERVRKEGPYRDISGIF